MRKASTRTMALAVVALASLTARAGDTPAEVGACMKDEAHYAGEKIHEHLEYLGEGCPWPCFYLQADVLLLRRDLTGTNFPATSLGVRGPILAQLQDLEFLTEGGARVTAGFRCDPCWSVEGTYFGQHDWFDAFVVTDPNSRLFGVLNRFGTAQQPIFPVTMFPATFGIGNNTFAQSGDYRSRLSSYEVNAVYDLFRTNFGPDTDPDSPGFSVSLLGGLRYLRMVENFSLRTRGSRAPGLPDDPGATADYVVDCENDAFGGQFGGRFKLQVLKNLALSLDAKCAVLANGVEQQSIATFTFNQPRPILGLLSADDGDVVTSYVGQLTSMVTWNVTKHVALRGGYDVLWWNRRALAPDQVDANATQNNAITPMINTKGTTMFYGASFGLELKF
jgi:hypothetical protein